MDREKMVQSLKDENKVVFAFLLTGDHAKILKMFTEDGYKLSAETLELLYLRGLSKSFILQCVQGCQNCLDAETLYNWLCAYLGKEETEDFLLLKCTPSQKMLNCVSILGLERNQRWDELQARSADDVLYKHGMYDKMSAAGLYKYRLFERYFKTNFTIDPNDKDALDYLAKMQDWNNVFRNFQLFPDNQNMLDFLIKHKQYTALVVVNPMVLTGFKEGVEFLQKNRNYHFLAEAKFYDKIDWDDWFKRADYSAEWSAEHHKLWDVLLKHKCHWTLLKHGRIWRFIKSFF